MLNLITPIGNQLGYGIVGLNVVQELHKQGFEFSLTPIGDTKVPSKYQESVHQGLSTIYNPKWPTIKIYHQFDMSMPETVKRIGWPIFELDNFNEQETKELYSCNQLLVCSDWAKNVIRNHFDDFEVNSPQCNIVPLGVDGEIFYHRPRPKNKKTHRFINVGKWEIRKGHDILPDIVSEWTNDGWELWMIPNNPFLSSTEDMEWKNFYRAKLGDRVKFFPRMDNQSEVADIIGQCDLGVFPSRGEGWNLDLVETMAVTGNYAYHTQYSAHRDIYTKLVGYPPKCEYELELAHDGKWFFGQGNWAKVDIHDEKLYLDSAINYMGFEDTKKFSDTILKTFSWENSVKAILDSVL